MKPFTSSFFFDIWMNVAIRIKRLVKGLILIKLPTSGTDRLTHTRGKNPRMLVFEGEDHFRGKNLMGQNLGLVHYFYYMY